MKNLILVIGLFFTISPALQASDCYREAQAEARRDGATGPVRLHSKDVSGFYVNKYGDVSYIYQKGRRECVLSYTVKGTYFGSICRPATALGLDIFKRCGPKGFRSY